MDEAVRAREANDHERAIALFEQLAAERPEDGTVLRLLGSSYAFAGRYREAIATLERARRVAPRDQDIALALARAQLWAGRRRDARRTADEIAAAQPSNPELPELMRALAGERGQRSFGLSIAANTSRVKPRGRGEQWWRELTLAGNATLGGRATISGDVEAGSREKINDVRLGARFDYRLSDKASIWIGATATPDADFRERWSVRGGGELRAAGSIWLTLDLRHADYGSADIAVVEPGVRLEFDDGRYGLHLRSINLWDETGEHRSGWSLRGDAEVGRGARLLSGAATYPDTEAGVTRRVRGGFVAVALPLTDRVTMRLGADYEKRAQSYERVGGLISLGWRFPR